MPRTKSARKSLASSLAKRRQNLAYQTALRALLKKVRSGEKVEQNKLAKLIDKAAKVRVIHPRAAARLKRAAARRLQAKQ